MIAVTAIARIFPHSGFPNRPIRFRSPVKLTSGTTAKASCSESTTCDSTSRSSTAFGPRKPMTSAAGTIARPRLIMRRSHGRMRMRRKPSITICPASVPVMVLDWPEDSSATANSVEASGAPSSGASSRCASSRLATSWCPLLWNTAAASTRIAAFTKNARFSATAESTRFMRHASRLPSSEAATARLCTSALWR